jgi:glycosyltransferase involved in cell wall biosynthesis
MPTISVIIPACNEAPVIGRILDEIHALGLTDYEIVVVDDGSSDGTAEVASAHGARVIRPPYNIGNGAAVKTGLRQARGARVVLMDGDGQHQPADIPALLRELDEYHMVVGARDSAGQAGWHRLVANTVYNWLATYITEFAVKDLTSGFHAVRRSQALRFLDLLPNTFSYPATITLAFLRSGLTVKYNPVQMPARVGHTKLHIWKDGVRFLLIIARIATLFAPLRVFLPVSLFFFISGFSIYVYRYLTEGRFTNMSAFLISTGVIVFMMGLISEQIASLRMERFGEGEAAEKKD